MTIELHSPSVDELSDVVGVLRDWQHTDAPMQLHPGDLGWFWRFGAEATAGAVRVWSRAGKILAIGMLDGPELLRVTVAPTFHGDERLAQHIVDDVADPQRAVLPEGEAVVEAPNGTRVQQLLSDRGWLIDEPWTPLRRGLANGVKKPDLRIKVVGPGRVEDYTAVHRSAFGSPRFTTESWQTMSTGAPYTDARGLLAYDGCGNPVAEVTVWSAGPGKPGLLEPMGVHPEHRGRGYGTAICVAAAAALAEMGSSSAMVCTPTANAGAIATYQAAGFTALGHRFDRKRLPGNG